MMTTKTCPACQKDNLISASNCSFCGAPLVELLPSRTTEPVPNQPVSVKHPDHVVQLTKLYANLLVFTVLGQEQPILVKGDHKVTIGRYSPGEIAPEVDLTPYNANLLGVSRQHAVITRSDKAYLLHDMDSTNGTWLNEIKLTPHKTYPLRSGDLIRLGQLALYVYFDTSENDEENIVEIVLKYPVIASNHQIFTFQQLTEHVVPYLTVLEQIQQVYKEITGSETSKISMLSLLFDPDSAQIKIKVKGIQDAIRILSQKGISRKSLDVPSVQNANSSPVSVEPITAQPVHMNGDGDYPRESRILLDFIETVAPLRSETEKRSDIAKLLSLISTLTNNPLIMVDGI